MPGVVADNKVQELEQYMEETPTAPGGNLSSLEARMKSRKTRLRSCLQPSPRYGIDGDIAGYSVQ